MTRLVLYAMAMSAAMVGVASCTSNTMTREAVSGEMIEISTDKALYAPGDTVRFTVGSLPTGATVRYRYGLDVVAEHALTDTAWTWLPPNDDFTGYLVDIYRTVGNRDSIYATIAVDVSSDWVMFPRYGFVGDYDSTKLAPGIIEREMAFLNRCHINGIQFYDWHYDHHHPLGGTPDNLMASYVDIGNREILADVVRRYIDVQHGYGMKAMFYNLCFGALKNAAADGVKDEWYAYRDSLHREKDCFRLPASFKSSIWLVDPGNPGWQQYISDRNEEVYASFDFDGYHIDQLGQRGRTFDYDGNPIDLPESYMSFIHAMKERHPDKRLVMNSVASFGAAEIAGSGEVDAAYNELWQEEDQFEDIRNVIVTNDTASGGTVRSILAAYMNYDKAGQVKEGLMNTPGVLLTDAVIMALGGDHLELGDHMLCREYFPAQNLVMSDELRSRIVNYYDFMTAYQNLLRGTTTSDEFEPLIDTDAEGVVINVWPPVVDQITAYGRNTVNRDIVHLLNFRGIDNLNWRDLQCERPAPLSVTDLPVTLNIEREVKRVWVASPDVNGGVPQELAFKHHGDDISFVVPSLEYWTMIVIE